MRILIDTNIILDLVQNREPHCENASSIINSCVKGEHMGYISSHSLSDLFYILRKDKSINERKAIILHLCKFFTIIPEAKDLFISICNMKSVFLRGIICGKPKILINKLSLKK